MSNKVRIELSDLLRIFPTYVTAEVPVKVLEDLVESSATGWPSKQNVKSPYLLSILRAKSEASYEKERIKTLTTLSGTEPPIQNSHEYDFLVMNLYELAKYTLDTFSSSPISDRFMLIVDERTLRDRTVILAEIPRQIKLDENKNVKKVERKFHRRDQYVTDSHGWLDEEGEYEGVEEIKVVRVTFEDANLVNMLDDEVETIGYLARHTYGTDGVYQAGAAYPGGL